MERFRADEHTNFQGPHQQAAIKTYGMTLSRAKGAMIMVHGRGATAEGILSLAEEFAQPDFHYMAPQAHNYAWYPYSFLASISKNEPGISSGLQLIHDLILSVEKEGIEREKIILLGFSQGACLASEFAARHPQKLGGLAVLSGGLIGPEIRMEDYDGDMKRTPVYLGCSDEDPHIPQKRVDESAEIFENIGARVTKKIYPGMGHTINEDEIKHIQIMMAEVLNA